MWNNQGFGASNGPQKGGGFMADSPGNFNSPSAGTQSDKKNRGEVKNNSVVPCTIAQAHKLLDNEEDIKIGSLTTHMITLVGLVSSVDEASTKITFGLDDMTGPPLPIQLWTSDDREVDSRSKIVENSYVRVFGTLRLIHDKRQLIAFKVATITDINEITMHLIEIIHTNMSIAFMDKQKPEPAMDTSEPNDTSMSAPVTPASTGLAPIIPNGLNPQQNMVLQAIIPSMSEDGVSFDFLCNQFKSLGRSNIRNILEFLSNEGHLYTTIDDDHFKATETM